ncbi:hypothetical protein [Cognatilysobacter terrigena]|uniref:hypothetical protein n=1 Tax=Cognatilysobacter terrigena TaxID=2488749 RepID=UPI00105C296A|nr:hypothetical protein [Lysobacter terrigena]
MKPLVFALLLAASFVAKAGEAPQLGFAGATEVVAEPDGKFNLNERAVSPKVLREQLVELDAQLHVGRINLRPGGAEITDQQVLDLKRIAQLIHADLFVERAGALQAVNVGPDSAP